MRVSLALGIKKQGIITKKRKTIRYQGKQYLSLIATIIFSPNVYSNLLKLKISFFIMN
jgi:hypothetical protein